jgi:hypothetical protein
VAITLKEETILNQWSMIVEGAGDRVEELLADVEQRLKEAGLPEGCSGEREMVQSSTWVSKVKREFLVCENDAFKDYRVYIGVRRYGKHLDVSRFVTVEPGMMKKLMSQRVAGDAYALSGPKNILVEQDLRAWLTVVHHAVVDAVDGLFDNLKRDRSKIRRESRGILEIW